METNKLFKTREGENQILTLYEEKLRSLDLETRELFVQTSYGHTHIIVSGSEKKPPIILVHGSNGNAAIALETYSKLIRSYQVFAVDVVAQPNKSAGTRLDKKDLSYGIWMNEVIDQLGLEEVSMAGFSFGGLVILKTLLYKEDNIKDVFLSAPAHIVNGNPLRKLLKMLLPIRRYMKTKDKAFVSKFIRTLFSDQDEFSERYLSHVFLEFDMDCSPIPVISSKEAAAIQTPIFIFGAEKDLLFPGKRMIKRAKRIFPSLKEYFILEGSKHVQGRKHNDMIQQFILNRN